MTSIAEAPDGTMWLGTNGYGLRRFDRKANAFMAYVHVAGDPNSLSANWTWDVLVDRSSTLWVATASGLNRYDPQSDSFVSYQSEEHLAMGVGDNYSHALYEDTSGRFWVGTSDGLIRFDRENASFKLFTPDNSSLAYVHVSDIVEDDYGNLWLAHFGGPGITRFDPEEEAFRHFGIGDGFRFGGSWEVARGQRGNILVGGSDGWTSFFPEQLEDDPITPKVWLTGLHVNGAELDRDGENADAQGIWEFESLELKHDQNDLTFEYVGLHFAAPERNRYDYMLEGFDEAWRGETAERTANYTNLPFGEYSFRVKAANGDGVWNETGASLTITILPPWWRTTWAYVVYGLLLVAGVYAVDRLQRRRLIVREREKTRERELAQAREIEQAYTQLKATQQQLIQSEKMASLGQLTAGIAHEIKNPLNFVNNFAELNTELIREVQQYLIDGQDDSEASASPSASEAHGQDKPEALEWPSKAEAQGQDDPEALVSPSASEAHGQDNPRELRQESEPPVVLPLRAAAAPGAAPSLADALDALETLATNAAQIAKHGDRADRIVRAMMEHATTGEDQRLEVALNAFVEEYTAVTYAAWQAQHPDVEVQIETRFSDEVGTVRLSPQGMGRVVQNILGNAFDAMCEYADEAEEGPEGRLARRPYTARRPYMPQLLVTSRLIDGHVEIRISDNGPGIPDAIRDKIFEPFFTTKPTGSGTGLGLSLSYDIVTQGHGGRLEVESTEGEGAAFVIRLPINDV